MIISIQYLRALAAFFVLLSHIAEKNMDMMGGDTFYFWQHAGEFGVDIFFIVSGYIMSYTTQDMYQKRGAFLTFIKKRFARIMPLYWVLSMIALVIYLLVPDQVNSAGDRVTVVFKSFFLLPVLDHEAYLLDVAWTLRDEFIFYFIFAIGLIFSEKIGQILVILILTTMLSIPLLVDVSSLSDYYHNFLHSMFIEFALGMILFRVIQKIEDIPKVLSLFFILFGFFLFYINQKGYGLTNIRGIDSGLIAFMISFGFVSMEKSIARSPISLFVKLGDASYSTYLLHPFILAAFRMFYNKIPLLQSLNDIETTSILVVVSLLFGYLCYIYVEKNLINLTKKIVFNEQISLYSFHHKR